MKKLFSFKDLLFIMVLSTSFLLASCKDNTSTQLIDPSKKYNVAINQFAIHKSLDNCTEGIISSLKEILGEDQVHIVIQNPGGDSNENAQIANTFANSDYDLLIGVATPAAEALYNVASKYNKPVIYTAVSDPIAVKLSNEEGYGIGITGTSDKLPVSKQLDLIRTILPQSKNIGIIYTTSEKNSELQLKEFESLAPSKGFNIISVGVSDRNEIPLAVESLLPEVDCLNNTLDNNVVQSLPIILEKAKNHNKLVFGSEIEQVIAGCIASEGIDYIKVGEKTGRMAARVLQGEDINTIKFETIEDSEIYLNEDVFKDYGIVIPEELLNATFVK